MSKGTLPPAECFAQAQKFCANGRPAEAVMMALIGISQIVDEQRGDWMTDLRALAGSIVHDDAKKKTEAGR